MIINNDFVKNIIKLYTDFKTLNVLSSKEFITNIRENEDFLLSDSEANRFLELAKHQEFVEIIAEDFLHKNFLTYVNNIDVIVIVYIIIFVIDDNNLDTLLQSFLKMNCVYLCNLLATLTDESWHIFLCQIACKFFEDNYVLENIVYPLLNKVSTINTLSVQYSNAKEVKKKTPTKAKDFEGVKRHTNKIPAPPVNTPVVHYTFKAAKVPKSTWRPMESVKKNILDQKLKNKIRANKLLEEARKVPERLTQSKKSDENKDVILDQIRPKQFETNALPVFKDVEVKGNLTTILREASRIIKNQNEEVRKIDDLIKGGYSREGIEKIEEECRKKKEARDLEAIEKNHLKGLLSHEEAILAKEKLLELNREKMEKFKEDRINIMAEIDKWREEEQIKIKTLVEKSQNIKQSAKESEKKLLKRKQEEVRMQQYETKQLLNQAYEEKMKELAKKTELIQEIKALHQVRFNTKEFDPTETPNLGLLCEMSIAELQERLVLAKMNMRRELDEKRQCILKGKEQHRLMVENVKNLISQTRRMSKPKSLPSVPPKLERSPDLIKLRQLLEEKRKLRNNL